MARQQSWAERVPVGDAARRGEERRLLVELELDDAVFATQAASGQTYGAPNARNVYAGHPSHVGRQSRVAGRGEEGRRSSPKGAGSPVVSRFSSPYKLKQKVLSSRKSSLDSVRSRERVGTYEVDRQYIRDRHVSDSGLDNDRRRPRISTGFQRESATSANSTALVREAIRQNIFLRDQILAQLQQEMVPPTLSVHRPRKMDVDISPGLIRELNRLRSTSLAIVEMVEYLYSECVQDNAPNPRNRRGRAIPVTDEEDAEALEREFLPYLLRMASSDTDFFSFSPTLMRFFNAQGISLTRNPFLEGLSLDASELLLCSCNYVSSSSPSELFSSSRLLASSPSSSSLFQLLLHKLEAFALQTDRYLPGWQVLPCNRVATALLHLMELETRNNASKLLPTYLRPHQAQTGGSYSSKSTENLRQPTLPRVQSADLSLCDAFETKAQGYLCPTTFTSKLLSDTVYKAWGPDLSDQNCVLPPVDEAMPEAHKEMGSIGAHQECAVSLNQAPCASSQEANSDATQTHAEPKSCRSSRQAKQSKDSDSVRRQPVEMKNTLQREEDTSNATGSKTDIQPPKLPSTQEGAVPLKAWEPPNSAQDDVLTSNRSKILATLPTSTTSRESRDSSIQLLGLEDSSPASVPSSRAENSITRTSRQFMIENSSEKLSPTIPRLDLSAVLAAAAIIPENRVDFAVSDSVAQSPVSDKSSMTILVTDAKPDIEPIDTEEASLRRMSAVTLSSCTVVPPGSVRSNLSDSGSDGTVRQLSRRSQTEDNTNSSISANSPLAALNDYTDWSEPTGGLIEDYSFPVSTPSIASGITRALDLLPKFGIPSTLDVAVESTDDSNSLPAFGILSSNDFSLRSSHEPLVKSQAVKKVVEVSTPSTSAGFSNSDSNTDTIPNPVEQIDCNSSFSEEEHSGLGALGKIFDLCRDVQVVALDLSHRFSEIEVDHRHQSIEHQLSPDVKWEPEDTPHYLQRELKILRRYLVEWRTNAQHRRSIKDRLQRSLARRTVRRFGVLVVKKRRKAHELEILEQQEIAARALQQSWADFALRKSNNLRSSDFHLIHRCFHRLKFFAGTLKRRRQREFAKEKILRWWRRRKAKIRQVLKREEELRRKREQKAAATKTIKQALREWVLRRKLAQAKVLARQTLFKENLKWTKAKRDHERLMRLEKKRASEKANLLLSSLQQLEQKWKQAEIDRMQLIDHHMKVVDRQQRVISKNRKSLAAHKIRCFISIHLLNRKLRIIEADRSLANKQVLAMQAQYHHSETDTQQWKEKMRLEQRLLQRRLEKSSKQMESACTAHDIEMKAHLAVERKLKEEMARRTIKGFIDYRWLERKSFCKQKLVEDQHQALVTAKAETEYMAAEELREKNFSATNKLLALEHRLIEADRDAQQQLATRDKLLLDKEKEVQMAAEKLEQSKVEANHALVTTWFSERVTVAKIKREADAALQSAAEAIELEKQRQIQLIETQTRAMASLKIGVFVTNQIERARVKRVEEMKRREQAERYALELITEQKLRSFVVEMLITVKLQSESEASVGIQEAINRVGELFCFIALRRSRLGCLNLAMKVRLIQRWWRRWFQIQQAKQMEQQMKVKRVEAVKRRECARRIQRLLRAYSRWRREEEKQLKERERKWQFVEAVRKRESARRIQRVWSRYLQWKRICQADRERRLRRLEVIRKRGCAKRIQTAWLNFLAFRQKQKRDQERKRLRVEAIKRRECVARIQRAWRASVKRRKLHRDIIERRKQLVSRIKRRECARRIQLVWRAFIARKRQRRVDMAKKKALIRGLKQRVCARKIQIAWRDAKERQQELLEEQEELERQMRVAALRKRAGARQIQGGWRRHNSRQRIHREQMDMQILRVEAIKRRECARHIQGGWRKAKERRRQSDQMIFEQDQLRQLEHQSIRCEFIRTQIAARMVQQLWRAWHHRQLEIVVHKRIRAIRFNHAARCVQRQLVAWHRSLQLARDRDSQLQRIRVSSAVRAVQRCWRCHVKWLIYLRQKQQSLHNIRRKRSARIIQHAWRQWIEHKKKSQQEQLSMLINRAAAIIQRHFRRWREKKLESINLPKEDSIVLYQRVCSRRIIRAWRRYRHVTEFAAATHIGSVWRGRCARQAYALALEAKLSQEARLEEIRLSILAVRVQHVWQDWRTRMRRRKRAEMLAREREMIEQAKRQARIMQTKQRIVAAHHIQKRFRAFSCQESKQRAEEVQSRIQRKQQEQETALAKLWEEKNARDEAAIREGVSAVVQLWTRMDLPYVLTSAVNNVLVVDAASRIVQRLAKAYLRRSQLWFYVNKTQLSGCENTPERNSSLRLYFKHASAWMELRCHSNQADTAWTLTSDNLLRLRFDAQMTRKLLVMLDRQSHSPDELQHATQEISKDALPIFATPECIRSHHNAIDHKLVFHEVGELELPHFCALTRSMAKIRSIHRRKQQVESPLTISRPPTPTSAGTAPIKQHGRVQSITVFEAVENASVEDAVYLQSLGVDLATVDPKTHRNALHMLTFSTENYRFRLEMLDFLLKQESIDVNAQDLNGDTPLMLFAANGHLEFMARLLGRGAKLQLVNKKGRNALHRACEKDQVEAIAFLHRGRTNEFEAILALHAPDYSGQFPLHLAAAEGLVECAKQLLWIEDALSSDHSLSTNWNRTVQSQRDPGGHTPLQLAVLARDSSMVSLLLAHGGEFAVNENDNRRRSVVHLAVGSLLSMCGSNSPSASTAADTLSILTLLIEHGADLSIGDERGDTALHWAALAGHVVLTRFLVTRGADIGAVNNDWETPVQVAAAHGQLGCVKAMASSPRHGSRDNSAHTADADSRDALTERILSEAVNILAHQEASPQSYYVPSMAAVSPPASKENFYWEELHQEVQLVDEYGHFSSEGESDSDADIGFDL